MRDAHQIARRAVVLGALSFRASLEVTEHPRSQQASERIMPWLNSVHCDEALMPAERELLNIPLGELPRTFKIDANWAGEQGMLYCWTLGLAQRPPAVRRADSSILQRLARVLQPGDPEVLQSPVIRDTREIEETCIEYVLIKTFMRERRVPQTSAREIVRRVGLNELSNVGLAVSREQIASAEAFVRQLGNGARTEAAGIYFVRSHSALWLFQ